MSTDDHCSCSQQIGLKRKPVALIKKLRKAGTFKMEGKNEGITKQSRLESCCVRARKTYPSHYIEHGFGLEVLIILNYVCEV
ncbi:hypothetical protein L6452_32269 [Arctium lappa]|uniref:Uncharacterized protein n=1 Tax=Arctium lappa TaxID=4217 RepID=A0ACB8Z4H8_ARCLA|nr:hypothetical protein L6452_32269 [Arctium lappa]